MKFTFVTLFPEMVQSWISAGLVGGAIRRGLLAVEFLNPRQFATDVHATVDDRAFGGGDGMVLKYEPLKQAIASLRAAGPCRVFMMSPQGEVWTQGRAGELASTATSEHIVFLCGRYAGFDQRLRQLVDAEISIGDYILNGGELAAAVILESVARLRPGVLGNQLSAENDSFVEGLLECPQFTRPREVDGLKVPEPLLSGHHREIATFSRSVSRVRTRLLRPDLLATVEPEDVARVGALQDSELKALGLDRLQLSGLIEANTDSYSEGSR